MTAPPAHDVTALLNAWCEGDQAALEHLVPLVYAELHRVAHRQMRTERQRDELQTTALIHEAYIRLIDANNVRWQNRAHFFAAAAEAMRRILIDRARRRQAVRHGGGLVRAGEDALDGELAATGADDAELIDIHEALDALARHDARKAEVVKQVYFVGLTFKEAALVLGISEPTAHRDWSYARAWLFNEIKRLRGS